MQRSAPWLRLVHAAEVGDEELAQRVLQQQPALFTCLSGNAARRIVGVAVRNNTRAIELLLRYGWPADATLENNQTALHFASWHGNLAMVRLNPLRTCLRSFGDTLPDWKGRQRGQELCRRTTSCA